MAADRPARLELVEEHVGLENQHDIEGVLATYADAPRYDDEPWGEHYEGREAVRGYYEALLGAAPDLRIDIVQRHVAENAVVLECLISGTHLGWWRGLPPTGRRWKLPLCAVYTFEGDRIAGERVYYDRASVLRQLGAFHEPDEPLGRAVTAITHPVTVVRALARAARSRRRSSLKARARH